MTLTVPGNQTNITLTPVDSQWSFALSANTRDGSTGLSPGWLCKYLYNAKLAKAPQLRDSSDITEDSILVQWIPVTCDNENQARVISYVLTYEDPDTGYLFIKV